MIRVAKRTLHLGTLPLSPKRVETHVHRVFMKLGLEPTADENCRVLAVLSYLGHA